MGLGSIQIPDAVDFAEVIKSDVPWEARLTRTLPMCLASFLIDVIGMNLLLWLYFPILGAAFLGRRGRLVEFIGEFGNIDLGWFLG